MAAERDDDGKYPKNSGKHVLWEKTLAIDSSLSGWVIIAWHSPPHDGDLQQRGAYDLPARLDRRNGISGRIL